MRKLVGTVHNVCTTVRQACVKPGWGSDQLRAWFSSEAVRARVCIRTLRAFAFGEKYLPFIRLAGVCRAHTRLTCIQFLTTREHI
eukprot:1107419-Pleurochrysis_carterae.AAC.1